MVYSRLQYLTRPTPKTSGIIGIFAVCCVFVFVGLLLYFYYSDAANTDTEQEPESEPGSGSGSGSGSSSNLPPDPGAGVRCETDQYVSGNSCVTCETGYINNSQDPRNGPDTECESIDLFCERNQYVSNNLCSPCESPSFTEERSRKSDSDTSCITSNIVCSGTEINCEGNEVNTLRGIGEKYRRYGTSHDNYIGSWAENASYIGSHSGWISKETTPSNNNFIQIDLQRGGTAPKQIITHIVTQGHAKNGMVYTYKVKAITSRPVYGFDSQTDFLLNENGEVIHSGPELGDDQNRKVWSAIQPDDTEYRFVRIYPQSGSSDFNWAMRVDIVTECDNYNGSCISEEEPMPIEEPIYETLSQNRLVDNDCENDDCIYPNTLANWFIKECQDYDGSMGQVFSGGENYFVRRYSSIEDENYGAVKSKLNEIGSWSPESTPINNNEGLEEFIQIDLGQIRKVRYVVTQGDGGGEDAWTTEYKIGILPHTVYAGWGRRYPDGSATPCSMDETFHGQNYMYGAHASTVLEEFKNNEDVLIEGWIDYDFGSSALCESQPWIDGCDTEGQLARIAERTGVNPEQSEAYAAMIMAVAQGDSSADEAVSEHLSWLDGAEEWRASQRGLIPKAGCGLTRYGRDHENYGMGRDKQISDERSWPFNKYGHWLSEYELGEDGVIREVDAEEPSSFMEQSAEFLGEFGSNNNIGAQPEMPTDAIHGAEIEEKKLLAQQSAAFVNDPPKWWWHVPPHSAEWRWKQDIALMVGATGGPYQSEPEKWHGGDENDHVGPEWPTKHTGWHGAHKYPDIYVKVKDEWLSEPDVSLTDWDEYYDKHGINDRLTWSETIGNIGGNWGGLRKLDARKHPDYRDDSITGTWSHVPHLQRVPAADPLSELEIMNRLEYDVARKDGIVRSNGTIAPECGAGSNRISANDIETERLKGRPINFVSPDGVYMDLSLNRDDILETDPGFFDEHTEYPECDDLTNFYAQGGIGIDMEASTTTRLSKPTDQCEDFYIPPVEGGKTGQHCTSINNTVGRAERAAGCVGTLYEGGGYAADCEAHNHGVQYFQRCTSHHNWGKCLAPEAWKQNDSFMISEANRGNYDKNTKKWNHIFDNELMPSKGEGGILTRYIRIYPTRWVGEKPRMRVDVVFDDSGSAEPIQCCSDITEGGYLNCDSLPEEKSDGWCTHNEKIISHLPAPHGTYRNELANGDVRYTNVEVTAFRSVYDPELWIFPIIGAGKNLYMIAINEIMRDVPDPDDDTWERRTVQVEPRELGTITNNNIYQRYNSFDLTMLWEKALPAPDAVFQVDVDWTTT